MAAAKSAVTPSNWHHLCKITLGMLVPSSSPQLRALAAAVFLAFLFPQKSLAQTVSVTPSPKRDTPAEPPRDAPPDDSKPDDHPNGDTTGDTTGNTVTPDDDVAPPVDSPQKPPSDPNTDPPPAHPPPDHPASRAPRTPSDPKAPPTDKSTWRPPAAPPPVLIVHEEGDEAPRTRANDEESDSSTTSNETRTELEGVLTLGWNWAALSDLIVSGPTIGIGLERFWIDLDAPFVITQKDDPETGSSWLGNRFGVNLSYALLRTERVRARLGVGGDFYVLWGIHPDESKSALSLRGDVTYWATENFGVELGLRAYPLASSGLSVQRGPGGVEHVPLFFTAAIHVALGGTP